VLVEAFLLMIGQQTANVPRDLVTSLGVVCRDWWRTLTNPSVMRQLRSKSYQLNLSTENNEPIGSDDQLPATHIGTGKYMSELSGGNAWGRGSKFPGNILRERPWGIPEAAHTEILSCIDRPALTTVLHYRADSDTRIMNIMS